MASGAELIALSESFRDMTNGEQVLDGLEDEFRALGATHFIATGVPLPGRPIEPLVLRMSWGDLRLERSGGLSVKPDDTLLQLALSARRPFAWRNAPERQIDGDSLLLSVLGSDAGGVGVPICAFLPYQAVVVAGGAGFAIDETGKLAIDSVCAEAFRRLFAIGYLRPERPGELSARERRVVELSAVGKTANQIATILEISQRTVHAHLQNASEKLRARNKTHTVVEALRYGQISV
jgi:LuxR family quorum sensing-dependent transcriptional regulator